MQRSFFQTAIFLICINWSVSGCGSMALGPTAPSGYRVVLPEASQTTRLRPMALTVHVRDASGHPVDDAEVHFRIPAAWDTQAIIDPPIVVTRQGQATATFWARTAGRMAVDITVEDHTATVSIVVLGETPRF